MGKRKRSSSSSSKSKSTKPKKLAETSSDHEETLKGGEIKKVTEGEKSTEEREVEAEEVEEEVETEKKKTDAGEEEEEEETKEAPKKKYKKSTEDTREKIVEKPKVAAIDEKAKKEIYNKYAPTRKSPRRPVPCLTNLYETLPQLRYNGAIARSYGKILFERLYTSTFEAAERKDIENNKGPEYLYHRRIGRDKLYRIIDENTKASKYAISKMAKGKDRERMLQCP